MALSDLIAGVDGNDRVRDDDAGLTSVVYELPTRAARWTGISGDDEGSFRAATHMFHRLFAALDGLHHAVLPGEPGFKKIYGQPIFDSAAARQTS